MIDIWEGRVHVSWLIQFAKIVPSAAQDQPDPQRKGRADHTGGFQPLENAPLPLDVRFIAATKSDLKALGERREFRSDLYYRLAASELDLPPLRERGHDVIALFEHFATEEAARAGLGSRPVPEAVLSALLTHDWPGNVRELKALATRFALGLTDGMPDRADTSGEDDAPGEIGIGPVQAGVQLLPVHAGHP